MQRDLKIGLSLGVLLLGVVGALLFRKQPLQSANVPVLKTAKLLDERISERERLPYMTGELEIVEETAGRSRVAAADTGRPQGFAPPAWLTQDEPTDPFETGGRVTVTEVAPITANARPTLTSSPNQPAGKQPPAARAPAPASAVTHVVQSGDSLSTISQRYYGTQTRYQEIFEANQDVLQDPNRLPLGARLRIPGSQPERNSVPAQVLTSTESSGSTRSQPTSLGTNREKALQTLTAEGATEQDPFAGAQRADRPLATDEDDVVEFAPLRPSTGSTSDPAPAAATKSVDKTKAPAVSKPADTSEKNTSPRWRAPFLRGIPYRAPASSTSSTKS